MTWALIATLLGTALLADAFLFSQLMVDTLREQAKEVPIDRPWYYPMAPLAILVFGLLTALLAWTIAHAWGKVRAKGVEAARVRKVKPEPEEADEDERPMAPPGFMQGPRIRKRRKGLAPLIGFNLLGLLLLGVGAVVLLAGTETLMLAVAREGRMLRSAVLWSQLVQYLGLPLLAVGGISLGAAWGRYFPLGELEIIEEAQAKDRPSQNFRWQQEF